MKFNKSEMDKVYSSPANGYAGVFLAVLSIFLIIPLFLNANNAHLGLQVCFTLIILSIMYQICEKQYVIVLGVIFAIIFVFLDVLSIVKGSIPLMAAAYSLYCLFLISAIVLLFKRVLTSTLIDTNLIFGALTIYLFSGILWSKFYFIYSVFYPGSFRGVEDLDVLKDGIDKAYMNQFNLLYYSYTTLSTLGVGDITPAHRFSKSLTILESMYGQLFVAIVIAKIVSVWRNTTDKVNQ